MTFLNLLPAALTVSVAVDINSNKHHRFVPGTGHRIEPPEALRWCQPDLVLLMHPAYLSEVRQQPDELALRRESPML